MPTRLARAGDEAAIAELVNITYARLRQAGALPEGVADWTAETVRAWSRAGYQGIVYVDNSGRIDAVAVGMITNHARPAVEPWMEVKILAIRYTLSDLESEHRKLMFRVLRKAVELTVERGAVGITCDPPPKWRKLWDFLQEWTVADVDRNDAGDPVRVYLRFRPGLPEFTQKAAEAGA